MSLKSIAENGVSSTAQTGFRIVNRVVDWITQDRMELINITDRVNDIVRKSGIRDGIVHLQSLHTTASVFLNEWQDALLCDVKNSWNNWSIAKRAGDTTTRPTRIVSARTPILIYAAWFSGRVFACRYATPRCYSGPGRASYWRNWTGRAADRCPFRYRESDG